MRLRNFKGVTKVGLEHEREKEDQFFETAVLKALRIDADRLCLSFKQGKDSRTLVFHVSDHRLLLAFEEGIRQNGLGKKLREIEELEFPAR